jgi:hypothetical protein
LRGNHGDGSLVLVDTKNATTSSNNFAGMTSGTDGGIYVDTAGFNGEIIDGFSE